MTLLNALGLTPTKAMLQRAAAAAAAADVTGTGTATDTDTEATNPTDIVIAKAAPVGAPLKRASPKPEPTQKAAAFPGADADDETRVAAKALRPQLAARHKQLEGQYRQISAGQAKLAALIAKAPPTSKPSLDSQKRQLDTALAAAGRRLDEARRDLEALNDPAIRREDLAKILPRAGSKAQTNAPVEVETAPGAADQKFNERRQVTTEVGYRNGEARIDKQERSVALGADGLRRKQSDETVRVTSDAASKVKRETTDTLNLDGWKRESRQSVEFEVEHEGETKTFSSATGSSLAIGPGGVQSEKSAKQSAADGSSKEVKTRQGIDRGDGRLGVSEGRDSETVDADGNTVGDTRNARLGVSADEKSAGGYAGAERGVSKKRRNGVSTGLVGGLHANVKCEIGNPSGNPRTYPVTLEVDLGAEITVGAGKDKEGAPGKAGAKVKLGADYILRRTYRLSDKELEAYVAALEAASTGGTVEATYREMAVIQAGVTQGWELAQSLAKGTAPLSKQGLAQLRNAGDSTEVATSTTAGAELSGNVKAVSVELGAEKKQDKSVKATLDGQKKLEIQARQSDQEKYSAKAGLSMGIVGASSGGSHTVRTSFGYDIGVDPANDPDGKLVEALARCSSKADYEKFIAAHKGKVTLERRTDGKAVADTSTMGMSIGPVEASIGTGSGTAEEVKHDADGRLIESTVVGSQHAGGGVKLGGMTWGDSAENQAVARRDAKGRASLDLSKKRSQTDGGKVLDAAKAKVGLGDDGGKKKGLLATATGGGEAPDTQKRDVYGIKLSAKDLTAIGRLAMSESSWTPRMGNLEDITDWRAAGARIKARKGDPGVVADELARYIGGAQKDRLQHVRLFLRPGGNVSIGTAVNFPDALQHLQPEYEELVDGECEQQVVDTAAREGNARATELGRQLQARLEKLTQAVKNSDQFGDKAAQADMVSALTRHRNALAQAVRQAAGQTGEADEKAAALEEFGRQVGACHSAKRSHDALLAELGAKVPKGKRLTQGEKNPLLAKVNLLLDARARLRAELKAAKALADRHGFPAQRYEQYQPDNAEIDRIKDACGMYSSS